MYSWSNLRRDPGASFHTLARGGICLSALQKYPLPLHFSSDFNHFEINFDVFVQIFSKIWLIFFKNSSFRCQREQIQKGQGGHF